MSQESPSAVITGSTSGIGKAIAARLLYEGYRVILNYSHDDQRAAAALEEARHAGGHCLLVKADIGRSGEAAKLIDRAIQAYGRVDVLINNAARVADAPALDMTETQWDNVLDVNLKGAFLTAQAAARHMLSQDSGGTILNIGASTGIRGRRNGVNTCASKAGLMIMTQCLALELAPKIRVNTIIPGLVITNETQERFGLDDPDVRRQREAAVPLARLGSPADVADAVMLAISADAQFMTGQKIIVDGGQNMW
ncbi:MAG TPA: SDR family NAD(P)-dependent oxidoreductase [Streptosporangiaceae bacterium]|jgi:NAD(P)-dependent dehydrogenase (short-subunit alcohol dehydrogenase family)